MDDYSLVEPDHDLSDYDIYGQTPPRTKILRKIRQRKDRTRDSGGSMASPKLIKAKQPLLRRNTFSHMFDELMAKAETQDSEQGSTRSNKRRMKLLRGSERDLKLDIASAQAITDKGHVYPIPKTPQPSYQVESCKRFQSLSCRTFPCSKKKTISGEAEVKNVETARDVIDECPTSRVEFYETFSTLLRMGCGDKTQERSYLKVISREQVWQNELKDLIWLELQAHKHDRTTLEEDAYLCSEREKVEPLLKDIMDYKFRRNYKSSTQSSDSGVEDDCPGCVYICCQYCVDGQNEALKEIEGLMHRLAAAEALFPSGKAFAELFPTYKSPEFEARLKALSLWYNLTRHQRLKVVILVKMLEHISRGLATRNEERETESSSPSDSNNSSCSFNDYLMDAKECLDPSAVSMTPFPVASILKVANEEGTVRMYIESILKTRTLHKSVRFFDKLQYYLLRKTNLSLKKPEDQSIFQKMTCETEEEELQRFGVWSPEAIALNLPSYRANFLYLGTIPVYVIHEFLKMRLEEKPEKPSPLSVRQLMRELKEGLKLACQQKEQILIYMHNANSVINNSCILLRDRLKEYDKCMLRAFGDYLTYLEQWALLHHDTFQKNLLEEEWYFSRSVVETIPGSSDLLATKFGFILGSILNTVCGRLRKRIDELFANVPKDDKNLMKQTLFAICRELQSVFNEERELSIKTIAFCKTIFKQNVPLDVQMDLSVAMISLKCSIPDAIGRVQDEFELINLDSLEDMERASLVSRMREILMQGYRLGFEFYKEISDSVPSVTREKLSRSMVHFAKLWMKFVTERCERGRGMRPRWAFQGLEFLSTVCEPRNTQYLTDEEFEELKRNMDSCITHVIGTTAPSTPESGFYSASPRSSLDLRGRSRGSSPSPRTTYKSQRSNSRKTSMEQGSPIGDSLDAISFNSNRNESSDRFSRKQSEAIETLENALNHKLRKQQLIGQVVNRRTDVPHAHFKKRFVTFTWQRGIKIGQGRFGKVYTAVNNKTGEMMAVKEQALGHNYSHTIQRVAEEMKILEGIHHEHLVRYYGVEMNKEEMLIFMEFCSEGTLETLCTASENGLPELLVRRYSFQLVSGLSVLHDNGIVHRDIKTANIFLTEGGNCLKIGDFGCAAKIKSNTTMPGELQGFVGTQAYMAPEVFTKNMNEGHGRAADIWSVGCVVVELASGKRPWVQYDSNFQIMFKVGMGQSPDPPDHMTDEGLDFLELCFKHNPKERATAQELLIHNFLSVHDLPSNYD